MCLQQKKLSTLFGYTVKQGMLIARIVKDDQTKIQVAKSAPNTGQARETYALVLNDQICIDNLIKDQCQLF